MKKIIVLSILCIVVFFLNIIMPFINLGIDYILLCKFSVLNESTNNYGLNIYYILLIPLLAFLLYYGLINKNKYIVTIVVIKLICVLTNTGIDNSLYYFFNEVPHMCLNKVILTTVK